MHQDMSIINARLEKLERKNRFLQRTNVAFAAVFSIALLVGWTQYSVPKVIEAERFVLKDAAGNVKSAWYSDVFKNSDTSYHQSRIEFYNEKSDTNIMIGFKKESNKPLLHLETTDAIFDFANPTTWRMKLYPTRLSLWSENIQDSLPGHGISLGNVWQPGFSMSNTDELFQMTLQDTGMTVERFGLRPEIVFYSNGKDDAECLNCDEKSLKKARRKQKMDFMKK